MEQAVNIGNIVVGLAAIIGLFLTVGKPISKLTSTLIKFEVELKSLFEEMAEHKAKNEKSNQRIYDRLDDHDDELKEHEIRLTKLEK